ncbi:hypothetical protein Nmel_018581 [Mimus melanotis]
MGGGGEGINGPAAGGGPRGAAAAIGRGRPAPGESHGTERALPAPRGPGPYRESPSRTRRAPRHRAAGSAAGGAGAVPGWIKRAPSAAPGGTRPPPLGSGLRAMESPEERPELVAWLHGVYPNGGDGDTAG